MNNSQTSLLRRCLILSLILLAVGVVALTGKIVFSVDATGRMHSNNNTRHSSFASFNQLEAMNCAGFGFDYQRGFAPSPATQDRPIAVVAGDINKDGKPDLVAANLFASSVSVLLGTGTGEFGMANNIPVISDGRGSPTALAMNDFDGDGNLDLAIAILYNPGRVAIFSGDGTGNFTESASYATGANTAALALSDLNGDGKLDIVAANKGDLAAVPSDAGNISILLNDGAGSFTARPNVSAGTAPVAVVAGDFNADGKADVAVANQLSNSVSVLAGDGTGTFPTVTTLVTGNEPSGLAAGYFDNDVRLDLAVTNTASGTVSIFLANGSGGFNAPSSIGAGISPYAIVSADFDGNGKTDLALTNSISNQASVLLNNGSGGFAAPIVSAVGSQPLSLVAADLNGDTKADLAVGNSVANNISILLGKGTGSFSLTTFLFSDPQAIAAQDFNADGRTDLAVANFGGDKITVFLADASGGYRIPHEFNVRIKPIAVGTGDFNGDGKFDLVAANNGSDDISILLATEPGDFGPQTDFAAGGKPRALVVSDFNQDGKTDVVTVNETSNNITLLRGNGDGTFAAPLTFATGTAPIAIAAGDLNNDGTPDLAVANNGSTFATVLLGNGTGGFTAAAAVNLPGAAQGRAVAIADVNNNGRADLLIALENSSSFAIALGNGDGTFAAPTSVNAGGNLPSSIAVADFNGDTKLDVAFTLSDGNSIAVLQGNGDGTFGTAQTFITGANPIALVSNDLNNDKRIDIAVVNASNNTMAILLNRCANTPPQIQAATGVTRIQGSPATSAQLAVVSDQETAAASLSVQITAIPTGLAITNLTNTNGIITANISAECTATLGEKVIELTVTDASGLKQTTNFIVTVAANTAPVLGTYANNSVLVGNQLMLTPSAAPTDNGTISMLTPSASAGFTGTLSINPTSGILTIMNAAPVGTHTITIQATDNCGAMSTSTAQIFVAPPVVLTSLEPATKQAQSGDFTLTVNGSGFTSNSTVRWNGADRPTTFISATKLTASIPGADINLMTAGSATLTVADPIAGGLLSSPSTFTISAPNPVPGVTSINPPVAIAGTAPFTLTVNGTNFIPQSVVKFKGIERTTAFTSATTLSIAVTAADIASPGTAAIAVVNPAPGGGTSSTLDLAINNPAPGSITLAPASVLVNSGATLLTVNGSGFRNSSVIRVNGTDRTTNFVSDTQLTTTLLASDLANAGTLQIAVNTPPPGGGLSPTATFTINNPAPAITGLSPNNVFAGDDAFTLSIQGTGFIGGSTVKWNGMDRATTFVSATQLSIAVPASDIANAGSAMISVSNPAPGGGTSNQFALAINNPAPVLTALDKTSAQIGSAPTQVILSGSKFRANSIVLVNGTERPTTFISTSQISVTLSTTDLATAGTIALAVRTPMPGGGTSSPLTFTVGNPVPALTTLAPISALAGADAFTLTLNGSGFVTGSVARLNGNDRPTTVVNSNQITMSVLSEDVANAGSAKVTIFNPAPFGGTSNELTLPINNPIPAPTALSQSAVTAGTGSTMLTVTGSGFRPDSVVRVNGSDRVTTFVSATQLKVTLLASDILTAGTLALTVSTPAPGGGVSAPLNVTINNPAPTLSIIGPDNAFRGDPAFALTITGTNFVSGSLVRWNGSDRPTTYVSATQLIAQIPERDLLLDGTVNVTVFNPTPGGGTSASLPFTIKALTGYEADVTPRPTGNNDGKVTIVDWVQVGRFAANLDSPQNSSEFQRADCAPLATNGDGVLTLMDWVQAGRFAVGLDPVAAAAGPSRPAPLLELTELRRKAAQFEAAQSHSIRTVRARNANFTRGELNALAIEVEAQGNENALAFTLNFDPSLLSIAHFVAPEGWSIQTNLTKAAAGQVGVMLALRTGQAMEAGKQLVLTAYFAPNGGAEPVTTKISFNDQIVPREMVDTAASAIPKAVYETANISISGTAIANVRAASYVGPELASESIASAFGAGLATDTAAANAVPLPTTLAGTSIEITDQKGITHSAPLFFVSPYQVNYLIPAAVAEGIATVTVISGDGKRTKGFLVIQPTAPSLFSADSTGRGIAAAQTVRVSADQTQRWENVAQYDAATNKMVANPIALGTSSGSEPDRIYLILYGTGFKNRTDLNSIQLKIGNVSIPIEYAGPQGAYAGVDQINARLPRQLTGRGELQVELVVDGKTANIVTIHVQ